MKQINLPEKIKLIEANEFAMLFIGILMGIALSALSFSFFYNYIK